ncbi:MAG: hypothetical protein MUF22_06065 [Chitinispirillaceae bacterium]|jgi:hypothetical protein|nr:hypothetical protein [Chitinispirillaceae bacterium]
MNKIIAGFLCHMLALSLSAEPWKIDINANTGTTLNAYSDSWEGGEAGSFTWTSQFLGMAEKQLSPIVNSKSTLKLQFGQTRVQDKTSKRWSAPEKSSDLIDGEELLRFTAGAWVEPFASVRVISQFFDGSDTLLDRYVNPLEISEALGASRTLRKTAVIDWANRLGVAARQLVDRNGLDPVSGTRSTDVVNDGGLEYIMDLKAQSPQKSVSLMSSLRLYEALLSSAAGDTRGTERENDWRYPHVRWENTLTLTFAKYLMLNLSAYAYYDKDKSDEVRLKETFSAGLAYLFSKK